MRGRWALSDLVWRCRESLWFGSLMYLALNPWRVSLSTTVPRILLQCTFLTLIGRVVGGAPGERYAFIGCVGFAALTSTLVSICDCTVADTYYGTYYRMQRGQLHPALNYLCRIMPYAVEGTAMSLLALVVVGPVMGLGGLSWQLVPWLPVYLLVVATSTMAGLAVAGVAAAKNADILLGNLSAYIVLATAGVVVASPHSTRWITYIGDVVPLTHGLAAIRLALNGGSWQANVLLEAAVGLGWLAVGLLVIVRANAAARR